ncbi:hypothetical protein EVAR_54782_1 [Eumeta japonica]|uniref:Uncharacterized protein n=1 Tax=Eumeta variegata TaxID=151549 RepID=A0A4C1YBC5_EUMVA|nr:hypothetical protein EVAR_54782_1 [Eumeta japonica]
MIGRALRMVRLHSSWELIAKFSLYQNSNTLRLESRSPYPAGRNIRYSKPPSTIKIAKHFPGIATRIPAISPSAQAGPRADTALCKRKSNPLPIPQRGRCDMFVNDAAARRRVYLCTRFQH